jgi:ATP-binding cassette subfamily F protein 3
MITLRNISIRRGPNVLLHDVNWTIYHKQRIGLIGENGSGKSTLFAMLLGELKAEGGDLELPRQLHMAHVAQETPAENKSILDFVLDGDTELRALEQQLLQAEQADNGERIATLHGRMGEIDAYTAPARAGQLLDGLGFHYSEQQKLVKDFSGGWRVRLNLAKALMCRSDILLLDEPTNHLDLDAVLWLENWLLRYPGTLLLISHDRDFLDRVVDHIAHLEQQQLKCYTGNYSTFERLRAAALAMQQAAYEKQQRQIAHMQSFVSRFKAKASKARQAQSRVKALERMEVMSAVQADSPFQFAFKEPSKCPNPLLSLDRADIGYDDHIVLSQLNFSIGPADRIALLGPNGAGKSSLIKLLAGELNAKQGECTAGPGLVIGYFAQHQVEHLRVAESPIDHLRKIAPQTKEQELRTFLGSFGFIGDRVFASIQNFSGGEKSRLALALIVWQKPNLLLLDEPTNHLDLEMRQALSLALQDYQGAMILVSHDRFLVRSTVDQLMLVAEGKAKVFDGDLDDYEKWLLDFRRRTNNVHLVQNNKPEKIQNSPNKQVLQQIKKVEIEIEKLEKQLSYVEEQLAEVALYEEKNKAKLQQHLLQQADIKKKLQEVEQQWLQAQGALESGKDE